MRRLLLLALVLAAGGCKTAEIAVTHPMTGVHVVAKFEAHEPAALPEAIVLEPAFVP